MGSEKNSARDNQEKNTKGIVETINQSKSDIGFNPEPVNMDGS